MPNIVHVMMPYAFELAEPGESDHDFGLRAAKAVEDAILEAGADKVAAFIGEPIMGAGGVKIPPASYWPEVQRICRKHDVLLMLDEVITGYGRTGEWFAATTFGVEPDTITTAKALTSGYMPLSALLVSDRIAATLVEKGGEFHHGYTYSGHPVACAVALKNLEIIEREGLIHRVKTDTGPYFAQALEEKISGHPLVGETRSVGLMGAIEIVKDKTTRERFLPAGSAAVIVRDHAIANGMMLRATGDTMILSPPLDLDPRDDRSRLRAHPHGAGSGSGRSGCLTPRGFAIRGGVAHMAQAGQFDKRRRFAGTNCSSMRVVSGKPETRRSYGSGFHDKAAEGRRTAGIDRRRPHAGANGRVDAAAAHGGRRRKRPCVRN